MLRHLSLFLVVLSGACAPPDAASVPDEPGTTAAPPDTGSAPGDSVARDHRPVVVFLGTSLTAGLGLLRDEETYVSRVAEMADSAGIPIRAVNAGVSGETSAGGLRRLDWVLRRRPDVLVVELGANDGLRGQDPDALARNLRKIIRRTRARYPGVPIVLAGMEAPPNLGPAYTDSFRRVFATLAREESVALIPFLLDGVAGEPGLNQADGIHPTAEGHRKVARNVWPVLEPILRSLTSPTDPPGVSR